MRDQALFNDVAEYLRKYPERHDQSTWTTTDDCGTHQCILGIGVHLKDKTQEFFDMKYMNEESERQGKAWDGAWVTKILPYQYGAELFGISREEARILFYGAWTPRSDLLIDEALEKLGAGAHLYDVTREGLVEDLKNDNYKMNSTHI